MARRTRAFTLVELLVVVGIIALLVTILMPALGRALELTRKTLCATNLHALGRGWLIYWNDYDNKLPQKHNPGWHVCDVLSRFDYMIYCGRSNTVHPSDFVNAGVLFKERIIADSGNYVCPTIKKNVGGVWFGKEVLTQDGAQSPTGGWWPVNWRFSTYMTYGRRRFNYYEDPELSNIYYTEHFNDADVGRDGEWWWRAFQKRKDREIMLYIAGVDTVAKPGDFSWMADRFENPGWVLLSHVPGINVSYMDGHVAYWEDPTFDEKTGTGKVLYDNGLGGLNWSTPNSDWYHDDIWMIIDGYHQPPVGQGF